MTFDFAFVGESSGLLSVILNDQELFRYEWFGTHAPSEVSDAGPLLLADELPPGSHVLQFRLDPLDDDGASVNVSNVRFGRLESVPVDQRLVGLNADVNGDGVIDGDDLDRVCAAVIERDQDSRFDLDHNGRVDVIDHRFLVKSVMGTDAGDANLDGRFNSADLVLAFQSGTYEDDTVGNSKWREGDWDCDGDFTSSDMVMAFQTGLYEVKSQTNARKIAAAIDWLFAQQDRDSRQRAYVA